MAGVPRRRPKAEMRRRLSMRRWAPAASFRTRLASQPVEAATLAKTRRAMTSRGSLMVSWPTGGMKKKFQLRNPAAAV